MRRDFEKFESLFGKIHQRYCQLYRNADGDYADVWNSDRIHRTCSCRCGNEWKCKENFVPSNQWRGREFL